MTGMVAKTTEAMIGFYAGDIKRINHFLCVHNLARTIGKLESLPPDLQEILEITALTHDIGIKIVEDREGSCTHAQQESEGPAAAKELLLGIGCPENMIKRICTLIGRHHTYTDIDGPDCQILLEADFLVNIDGLGIREDIVRRVKQRMFKTRSGLRLLNLMYGL